MRLYPLTGASAVDHGGVHYEAIDDGGFDFPDELADQLHSAHVDGIAAWETYAERHARFTTSAREQLAAALSGAG